MKRLILLCLALVALISGAFVTAKATRLHKEEVAREEAVAREATALRVKAESGDVAAQVAFAHRLRRGDGVGRDPAAAFEWYRRAAQRGATTAAAALGDMYEAGDGVPQDYFRAADWYRLAVSFGGPAEAYYALGRMHLYGRGVPHDVLEAFTLIREAAERRHGAAQHVLAMMYDEGWGTDRDRVEAYKWLTLASQQPHPEASVPRNEAARTRLAGRLNSQQIREAEKRARDWTPK